MTTLSWNERVKKVREKWVNDLNKEIPCKECVIKVTCTRSFTDGTACDKLEKVLREKVKNIQIGKLLEEVENVKKD